MAAPTVACRPYVARRPGRRRRQRASGVPAVECDGPGRPLRGRHRGRRAVASRPTAGEVVAVLGPNGAGKTSTVESLEGYRRPAAGAGPGARARPGRRPPRRWCPRIGVMLQRGGVYPMLGPRRVLELFAAYYDDPEDPDAAARPGRPRAAWPARRGGTSRAASSSGFARPRPGRPARRGVPRRADRRGRPRGPPGHPRTSWPAARPGRLRAAHHPRAGRGRAAGRPGGDRPPGPGAWPRARPPSWRPRRRRRPRCASALGRASTRSRSGRRLGVAGDRGASPGRYRVAAAGEPGTHRRPGRLAGRARRDAHRPADRRARSRRPTSPSSARRREAEPRRSRRAPRTGAGVRRTAPVRPLVAQVRAETCMTLRRGETLLADRRHPGRLPGLLLDGPRGPDRQRARRSTFFVPGILALAVMSTAMVSLGIATGFERGYGVLKRLGCDAARRPRLLGGQDRHRPARRARPGGRPRAGRPRASAGTRPARARRPPARRSPSSCWRPWPSAGSGCCWPACSGPR